ncbi:MAG: glycosyltransferase family 39 protein [Planctomycetaceae bacterium]|nr:glycosyltransferase family 39 protein [Planctomycetaceae bacterium]
MSSTPMMIETQQSEDEKVKPVSRFAWLSALLFAGAVLRILIWNSTAGMPVQIVDAQDYNRLAVGLVETGKYLTPSGELSSQRPPLYPWLVAQIYRLHGVENFQAVRAWQGLLSLCTVLLVYRLGVLIYSPSVGLWAAAFATFYPSLLGFNCLLLSETLFTFLLTAGTCLILEAKYRNRLWLLALAGVVMGLAALTRSVQLMTLPFLGVYLGFVWNGKLGRKLIAACLPILFFGLTIAPWSYRNTQVQEVFTLIDVMGGRNAMMGNYEHTPLDRSWATISDVTGDKAWHVVLQEKNPEVQGMTQGQLDKAAMKYGIEFVLKHPVLSAQRTIVRFFNFWQLERTLVAGTQKGLWGELTKLQLLIMAAVIMGAYATVMYAAFLGMWLSPPEQKSDLILLGISILVPCLIHSAIFAHSRYHLPLMPLMYLFAAAAVTHLRVIYRQLGTMRFWLAISCCLILTLGWLREIVFVDLAQTQLLIN